jgi:hypothetical protein
MFRMQFQTAYKPFYQPPNTNIQVRTAAPTLAIANPVVFGNIFGKMVSNGPCSSCGGK